jgi:hypothetical protein
VGNISSAWQVTVGNGKVSFGANCSMWQEFPGTDVIAQQ